MDFPQVYLLDMDLDLLLDMFYEQLMLFCSASQWQQLNCGLWSKAPLQGQEGGSPYGEA